MATAAPPAHHGRMDTTTADAPTEDDGPPPSDPPPGRARPARILRSGDDRVLGGVAGGIAECFAIDPLLVRLGFVVASFLGGVGVVAYIVTWIVLPTAEPTIPPAPRRTVDTRQPTSRRRWSTSLDPRAKLRVRPHRKSSTGRTRHEATDNSVTSCSW